MLKEKFTNILVLSNNHPTSPHQNALRSLAELPFSQEPARAHLHRILDECVADGVRHRGREAARGAAHGQQASLATARLIQALRGAAVGSDLGLVSHLCCLPTLPRQRHKQRLESLRKVSVAHLKGAGAKGAGGGAAAQQARTLVLEGLVRELEGAGF